MCVILTSEWHTWLFALQDSLPSSQQPLPEHLKPALRLPEEPVLRTEGFMGLQNDIAASTLLAIAEARAESPLSDADRRTALKQALADVDSLRDVLQQVRRLELAQLCAAASPVALLVNKHGDQVHHICCPGKSMATAAHGRCTHTQHGWGCFDQHTCAEPDRPAPIRRVDAPICVACSVQFSRPSKADNWAFGNAFQVQAPTHDC